MSEGFVFSLIQSITYIRSITYNLDCEKSQSFSGEKQTNYSKPTQDTKQKYIQNWRGEKMVTTQ